MLYLMKITRLCLTSLIFFDTSLFLRFTSYTHDFPCILSFSQLVVFLRIMFCLIFFLEPLITHIVGVVGMNIKQLMYMNCCKYFQKISRNYENCNSFNKKKLYIITIAVSTKKYANSKIKDCIMQQKITH
ncbi:hypothetical protein Gromo_00167 [Candidatus Gromoviella agglomerans]|nr:hypothetical protein Gromo_00167 [Candidatus Gromoviella agglomerans]